MRPPVIIGPTGCSLYSKEETTPKFPPPPRTAQKRSLFSSPLAVRTLPSAVTISAEMQIVERQAMLAHQPAEPAAQSEAGDAGRRHDAAGRGKTMKLGLAVEFAPGDAALRPRRFAFAIDMDALHRRQIDHDAVVDRRSSGDIVAPASHRDLKAEFSAERQGIDDVGDAVAARDQRRPLVDETVMDASGIVIAR